MVVSVGTLVALVAVQTVNSSAAAIYYLVHSTLVSAALFLLADLVGKQRGKVADRITAGRPVVQPMLLGIMFAIAAITVIGMPPLSGFIGKVWILKSTIESSHTYWFWAVYLLVSLAVLVSVSKAGSTVFWHHTGKVDTQSAEKAHPAQIIAILTLITCAPLMVIFAGPLTDYALSAADSLHDFSSMTNTVLKGAK